jgi:hypothetical protein
MTEAPHITPSRIHPPTSQEIQITTAAEAKKRSQELGLFGKLFGSREHAPINIAGAIILLGVIGVMALPFLPTSAEFSKADIAKLLGSLVLSALTFLGGYLGAGKT